MIQLGNIPSLRVQVNMNITKLTSHTVWRNRVSREGLEADGPHVIVGISRHLGQLHPVVRHVVDQNDQGANPVHLSGPAEREEGEGGQVVDEHLHEVLPLDIRELGEEEGPVESHFKHVVPPNLRL